METTYESAASSAPAPSRLTDTARIYLLEARSELLKVVRMPAYAIPTLAFPAVFYTFFALTFGRGMSYGPVSAPAYLLATYGSFGVIGAAFFGFGVGVAIERGQGWLLVKRASPMPMSAYFLGKVAMAAVFGAAVVALLFSLGILFGGVEPDPSKLVPLAAILIAGTIPFSALGLWLGFLAGPNSAPAIVNLVYLPMAFLSGLWIPIQGLPETVQRIAHFLPAYHHAQLALGTIGGDVGESTISHLLALAGFTAIFLLLAGIAYRRDQGRTWG